MRVLALTKYGRQAASARQRLLQFEPFLGRHGIAITTCPLLDDNYVGRIARGQPASMRDVLGAYLRRLRTLLTVRDVDAVWVAYELFPYLPGPMERLVSLMRKPVIVDYDDAIFHMYDAHRRAAVRWALGRKLEPLIASADMVVAGNQYLETYARRFNPAVALIPTVVDTRAYLPARRETPLRPVVGWIGSPSTWRYVEPVLPALLPVIARAGGVFRAIGAGPAAQRWPGIESIAWAEATEVADVQAMDVGIMPLPDEEWARGKCGYKLIQYMACGLPTVASPVGVNSAIVRDGETGFLVHDEREWVLAVGRLLADNALRRSMGNIGRERVVDRYSLHSQEPHLLRAFQAAVSARSEGRHRTGS